MVELLYVTSMCPFPIVVCLDDCEICEPSKPESGEDEIEALFRYNDIKFCAYVPAGYVKAGRNGSCCVDWPLWCWSIPLSISLRHFLLSLIRLSAGTGYWLVSCIPQMYIRKLSAETLTNMVVDISSNIKEGLFSFNISSTITMNSLLYITILLLVLWLLVFILLHLTRPLFKKRYFPDPEASIIPHHLHDE